MDILERLRFDAARCELQFSKGVAGNIEEAAAEIERLRAALDTIVGICLGNDGASQAKIHGVACRALEHPDWNGYHLRRVD